MIAFTADYHTHTRYSDGKGMPEDNVRAAISKGLKTIAITDHGPGHIAFGCRNIRFEKLKREVDRLKEKYIGQINILLGVEANILTPDGKIDINDQTRKNYDIVLLGYHRTAVLLSGALHFTFANKLSLSKSAREKAVEKNTRAYIKAISGNDIDILVHPGLFIDIFFEQVAEACANKKTLLELSAHPKNLKISEQDAKAAKQMGAIFVVNSDAHRPSQIGIFEGVTGFLERAGLTEQDIYNAQGYNGFRRAGI